MSTEPNNPKLEAAITKLHDFLTTHWQIKSEEELRNSSNKLYASNLESLSSAEMLQRLKDLKANEEFLPVLDDLPDELQQLR